MTLLSRIFRPPPRWRVTPTYHGRTYYLDEWYPLFGYMRVRVVGEEEAKKIANSLLPPGP